MVSVAHWFDWRVFAYGIALAAMLFFLDRLYRRASKAPFHEPLPFVIIVAASSGFLLIGTLLDWPIPRLLISIGSFGIFGIILAHRVPLAKRRWPILALLYVSVIRIWPHRSSWLTPFAELFEVACMAIVLVYLIKYAIPGRHAGIQNLETRTQ